MADVTVRLDWTGEDLVFEGRGPSSPPMILDSGGTRGPSPTQSLLLAVAGCTAADVIDILGRMRRLPEGLSVEVDGDRAPAPPRRYTRIRLTYRIAGLEPADEAKVRRAISLSQEKYCSVLHTLRPDLELETEIVLG